MDNGFKGSLAQGALIGAGLAVLGYLLGSSAIRFKEYERVVSVKGAARRTRSPSSDGPLSRIFPRAFRVESFTT